MAKCGWCKTPNLETVPASTGRAGDSTLEKHTMTGTVSTECKGPVTYNQLDSTGKPAQNS